MRDQLSMELLCIFDGLLNWSSLRSVEHAAGFCVGGFLLFVGGAPVMLTLT